MDPINENSTGNNSVDVSLEGIDLPKDNQSNKLDKLEETGVLRDEKGRILPGQQSLNPLGRGAGQTLKEYKAKKYKDMTDREKDEELAKMSPELQWRMAEGNPHTTTDTKLDGEITLNISKEIADKLEPNEINTKPSDNSEGQDQI